VDHEPARLSLPSSIGKPTQVAAAPRLISFTEPTSMKGATLGPDAGCDFGFGSM
jgi:hypothetical protein